tara:strand:+ start:792 stop:950 length:159 start_codon:yes stop_codon:yes gene_type:complete
MGKKSSRAQAKDYTPVDQVMHEEKVKARKSDAAKAEKVRQQSSLLKELEENK